MSLDIPPLELSMDSALWTPLPEIWSANFWSNASDQPHHSTMTGEERQLYETHPLEEHVPDDMNHSQFLDASMVSPKNVSMHVEPFDKLPAHMLQESSGAPMAAPTVLSQSQNPPISPVSVSEAMGLRTLPGPFTVGTTNGAHTRQPYVPRPSFPPIREFIPEQILHQFYGTAIPFTYSVASQDKQVSGRSQAAQNWHHTPLVAHYSPDFRREPAVRPALSVLSTTAVKHFTLTTSEVVLGPPHSSQILDALPETKQVLSSRGHGGDADRYAHCREQGRPDFHILKSYKLDGFRYAKVWIPSPEGCPHCDKHFANMTSLREHTKRTHRDVLTNQSKPVEKVKCLHCQMLLMNKTNLRRHVERVHIAGEVRIACEMCTAFFSSRFSATTHMRDIHGIRPASRQRAGGLRKKKKIFFRCEMCGYYSKEKSNMTRHMNSNHVGKRMCGGNE